MRPNPQPHRDRVVPGPKPRFCDAARETAVTIAADTCFAAATVVLILFIHLVLE